MKLLFLWLAFLAAALSASAQSSPEHAIHPLTIGDTIPDIELNNLINYHSKTARLSDFKGKLVILDFWSSWCAACIRLFPYMDSLRKRFPNDLQIILVNSKSNSSGDDEKKIRKIMDGAEKRSGQKITLPVAFDNPLLDAYFPLKYLPHEVWLDSNGVVLAITSSEEVTASNISFYFNEGTLSLHTKEDNFAFDENKPLFVDGNGGSGDHFLFRSILTPYTEGLLNNIGQVHTAKTSRLYIFNQPFSTFARMAYPKAMSLPRNRIILEGSKIKELMDTKYAKSAYSQLFCYDLIVPKTTESLLHMYLQRDLERTFGIQVRTETKKMECFSLTATNQIANSFTNGDEPKWDIDVYSKNKFMQNQAISIIVQVLNTYLPVPLLDETGVTENIDLKLPENLNDTTALFNQLRKAGFNIQKVIRELPITIISAK